jgi:NitT/TauT family transport system permease protein
MMIDEIVADTMAQDRPLLPAPHQVAAVLWDSTVEKRITSRRSLSITADHAAGDASGLRRGRGMGILLAVGIVHNRAMD